ncbi:hypothetical protein [Microbispora sp. NPDC049125]|uniref:hypothetical protein n=1 Tax=Microbispora sp. NPDC049125 TaxID=3154929 RepID=UPI003465E890
MSITDHRTAIITGLRALATYLETHPAVPVPRNSVYVMYFPKRGSDAEICAEIDRIATLLATPVERTPSGHYTTVLEFGPVRYEATAVPADARARHEALISYTDCITPDTPHATNPAHAA